MFPTGSSNKLVSAITGLAVQTSELFNMYQTPTQPLNLTLTAFGNQMTGLNLITNPIGGFADVVIAGLPTIDIGKIAGSALVTPQFIAPQGFEELFRSIDISALGMVQSLSNATATTLTGIAKTSTIINSEAFRTIYSSLGSDINQASVAPNFLQSLLTQDARELKAIVGDTEQVKLVVSVISGNSSEEALTPETKSAVEKARPEIYQNGITAIVLIVMIVSMLHLLQERSLDVTQEMITTVLALLVLLKEKSEKEQK